METFTKTITSYHRHFMEENVFNNKGKITKLKMFTLQDTETRSMEIVLV